jgi:hypothetical protein
MMMKIILLSVLVTMISKGACASLLLSKSGKWDEYIILILLGIGTILWTIVSLMIKFCGNKKNEKPDSKD